MAKTKQAGKTRQHTTRPGKRLGLKVSGGQMVQTGAIIIRQKGTVFHQGDGVGMGRDHTIYARRSGTVVFRTSKGKRLVIVR